MQEPAAPLAYLTAGLLAAVAQGSRADLPAWVAPLRAACLQFGITTPRRLAAFLAQVAHESGGFEQLGESLNYSVAGLRMTFPGRVPQSLAERIGRKPGRPADQRAIAEAVYGGRLGNLSPRDAWIYRGAGLIQITGFANHDAVAEAFRMPVLDVPAWLRTPEGAALSAAWWWNRAGCNELADAGAFDRISRTINGGDNGREDRRFRYAAARKALGL